MTNNYMTAVKNLLAFYGFAVSPLSDKQIETCETEGLDPDNAYLVACDVNAGYTFTESLEANF